MNGHLKTVVAICLTVMGSLLIINMAWLIHSHSLATADLDGVVTVISIIIGALMLLGGIAIFGGRYDIKRKQDV